MTYILQEHFEEVTDFERQLIRMLIQMVFVPSLGGDIGKD